MKVSDEVIDTMVHLARDVTIKAGKARHVDELIPIFTTMQKKLAKLPPGLEDESRALLVDALREGGWKRLDVEATKSR